MICLISHIFADLIDPKNELIDHKNDLMNHKYDLFDFSHVCCVIVDCPTLSYDCHLVKSMMIISDHCLC